MPALFFLSCSLSCKGLDQKMIIAGGGGGLKLLKNTNIVLEKEAHDLKVLIVVK